MKVTVDVPEWLAEAIFENSKTLAHESAMADIKQIEHKQLDAIKRKVDKFVMAKAVYEQAEADAYLAKWVAEDAIEEYNKFLTRMN